MNEFNLFLTKGISSLPFYNQFSNTPEAIDDAVKTEKNESSNNLDKNIGDISFAAEAITNFNWDNGVSSSAWAGVPVPCGHESRYGKICNFSSISFGHIFASLSILPKMLMFLLLLSSCFAFVQGADVSEEGILMQINSPKFIVSINRENCADASGMSCFCYDIDSSGNSVGGSACGSSYGTICTSNTTSNFYVFVNGNITNLESFVQVRGIPVKLEASKVKVKKMDDCSRIIIKTLMEKALMNRPNVFLQWSLKYQPGCTVYLMPDFL